MNRLAEPVLMARSNIPTTQQMADNRHLVTLHDFPEIRWNGHWIWVPEEPIKPRGILMGAFATKGNRYG
jgi:hypothetical protein